MINSGNNYTIAELLAGNLIVEIPDMQRDYCWATTISENNNKSLVFNFIDGLVSHLNHTEALQMGLLYGYESPKNHLQLCDGQQRITTIFLALGCLYQRLKNTELGVSIKSVLVYPNEVITTPRFQYGIRETTLTFLTDLLANHWLSESPGDKNIEYAEWYFSEYKYDPSIQNILIALETINQCLNNMSKEDQTSLAQLLLYKVSFLYFDMVNRTYGEEQFVVLNTTGKPLSKTENLKPKFLGDFDDVKKHKDGKTKLQYYSDMWEGWEYYFWKNKNPKHPSADKGFNEFLRWIFIIEKTEIDGVLSSKKEEYRANQKALASNRFDTLSISNKGIENLMELINKYFEALRIITKDDYIKSRFLFSEDSLSQIQCLEFLPLLNYLKEQKIEPNHRSFFRLKQFLSSRAKDENVSKATITTSIEAIKLSKLIKDKDIADPKLSVSSILLNDHERLKFDIYRNANNREALEDAFWKAERFDCSKGNISYMLTIVNPSNSIDNFPIDSFNKLSGIVERTLNQPTDQLRRVLLTFGNYFMYHGWTSNLHGFRYSLGENADFFSKIVNNEIKQAEVCINFLIDAFSTDQEIDVWQESRINNYVEEGNDVVSILISKLIKDEKYLKEANRKLICISDQHSKAYVLKNQKVTNKHSYLTIP